MGEDTLTRIKQHIEKLFGPDAIHGYDHAIQVHRHAKRALEEVKYLWNLNIAQYMDVQIAALLHDVDDDKIFPGNGEHLPNARKILHQVGYTQMDDIIEMIHLVGFGKNGIRNIYQKPKLTRTLWKIPRWKLIPRDADRLEALGKIGVARCVGYGCQIGRPLYSTLTPRLTQDSQIRHLAVRYWLTQMDIPCSTVDYFIRGLIIRCIMSSNIDYFNREAKRREEPILELIRRYGHQGFLTKSDILHIVDGDAMATSIIDSEME